MVRACFLIALGVTASILTPSGANVFADPPRTPDVAPSGNSTNPRSEIWERYSVTLSEYHVEGIDPTRLTSAEVIDAIMASDSSPSETVMLTCVAGTESIAQFSRVVTVTVGQTKSQTGTARRTDNRQIGTILQVEARPEGPMVLATLSYNASRQVGDGTDDSPPDLMTTTIDTTQLFDLGQPTLLGGSTSGQTSFVIVTIRQS